MSTIETLKMKMDKARDSVKRQKKAFNEAKGTDKEALRARILKAAQTKLENAEKAYKGAKKANRTSIKDKASNAKKTVIDNGKKAFSWTGLAIITVVTAVGGFMIYDHVKKDGEEAPATDTV